MNTIKLLDCTLRDGGYINDWRFGEKGIAEMTEKLCSTNVDIFEIGFLKNEPYDTNRTVFNDVDQITRLVTPKRPHVQYAAMIEVVNPLPLDQLKPFDGKGIDIIRVIVWKTKHVNGKVVDALEEGFTYCKGIVEKGYKLCVQPARVDQYSDEEFIAMVRRFSALDPMAIYVVDSWGTQNPEQLLHYMHLADENMPRAIAVGYHGHNNMMQALSAAQQMIHEGFDRELIIDASVFGIGRGAGNLNLELIAKYMNETFGKAYEIEPMLEVYSKYIVPIYNREKWGYSNAYYLTAKYNVNPDYARYFEQILCLNPSTVDALLSGLGADERTMFNQKTALKKVYDWHQKRWKKKLCVVIPTANRPASIFDWLNRRSREFSNLGVDLIIFDSSSNDETKKVVSNYTDFEGSTVRYVRYDGVYDGVSLDHKVIEAYSRFGKEYEYVWPIRDGHIINIWNIQDQLYRIIEKRPDTIVVYDRKQNIDELQEENWYTDDTDLQEMLRLHLRHMTILGCNILSADFIENLIQEEPLDSKKNYSLWQPFALFHYWSRHTPRMAVSVGDYFSINVFTTPSSHWNKGGHGVWQWAKRWYELVNELPEVYGRAKDDVMKIGMADFAPFDSLQLVVLRGNKGISLPIYRENKKYFQAVSYTPGWKFIAVSLVPCWLCRAVIDKPYSLINKLSHCGYSFLKRAYHAFCTPSTRQNIRLKYADPKKITMEQGIQKYKLALVILARDAATIRTHLDCYADVYCKAGIHVNICSAEGAKGIDKAVQQAIADHPGCISFRSGFDSNASLYREFANQYNYVWIIRDDCPVSFENIMTDLIKALDKKPDFISVGNKGSDYRKTNGRVYNEAMIAFREQFCNMLAPGHVIFSADLIRSALAESTKDSELFDVFTYCANNAFIGISLRCKAFTQSDEYVVNCMQREGEFERWSAGFYDKLRALPKVYASEMYDVLIEWNNLYGLLGVPALLYARSKGTMTRENVKKNENIIPQLTFTDIKDFYMVASFSRWKASKYLYRFPEVCSKFSEPSPSRIGNFEMAEHSL